MNLDQVALFGLNKFDHVGLIELEQVRTSSNKFEWVLIGLNRVELVRKSPLGSDIARGVRLQVLVLFTFGCASAATPNLQKAQHQIAKLNNHNMGI